MNKPVQYYDPDYVARCKEMSTEEVLQFLEDFRLLSAGEAEKCKLISLKIEPSLLRAFKLKAEAEGVPYQTKIKSLMRQWLNC